MLFDEREFQLMKLLRNCGEIPSGEEGIAYRLASLSLLRLGFRDTNGHYTETGHLSELGKNLLRREELSRRPIVNFLYEMFGPLFVRTA